RAGDPSAVAEAVCLDHLVEQGLLVTEGRVQAAHADAERGGQVADRRRLVALSPEQPDGLVQGRVPVERPGPPAPALSHGNNFTTAAADSGTVHFCNDR